MTAITDFVIDREVRFTPVRRRVPTALIVSAIVVTAVLLLAYFRYGEQLSDRIQTDDASLQADSVPVVARLSGRLIKVMAAENDVVAAGATLAMIDPDAVDIQVRAADARVQLAAAGETEMEARIAEADGGVRMARADWAAQRSEVDRLSAEIDRYRPLVATGAESGQTLSQLKADYGRATAQMAARAAAVATAVAAVGTARSHAAQAQAQLGIAKADRDTAQNTQSMAQVSAPASGRIGGMAAHVGQYVRAGQQLAKVIPVNQIYVIANFKETQIGHLRPGQPARVFLDPLPDVAIPGVVESISAGTKAEASILPAQNATGNFTKIVQRVPVRIRIRPTPQVQMLLISGLSATAEVDTAPSHHRSAR